MDSHNEDVIIVDEPLLFPDMKLIIKPEKAPSPSYLKLYQKSLRTRNNWILIACTEINEYEPVPTFSPAHSIKYNFSQSQKIRAEIYNVFEEESILYGFVNFDVSTLVKSPEKKITLDLICPNSIRTMTKDFEHVTILLDEPTVSLDLMNLKLGLKFHKRTFLKRSSYYDLYEMYNNGTEINPILQSPLGEGREFEWPATPFRISDRLKREGLFRLVVRDKSHKIKGNVEFSYKELVTIGKREYKLLKQDITKGGLAFVEKGIIKVSDCSIVRQTTIVDYFSGGLSIQSYFGLDFSNYYDLIQDKTMSEEFKTQCKQVFKHAGNIFYPYLDDKVFNVYGLAGHCGTYDSGGSYFPIYGDLLSDPRDSLLPSIEAAFNKVEERTLVISPILQEIVRKIKDDVGKSKRLKYYVVFLVISGPIKDFYEFIDYLIMSSYEIPASFLLLGVGNEKFSQLATIEDQFGQLKGTENLALGRKNYRFCMLKNFGTINEAVTNLFSEVPRQIIGFTDFLNLRPKDFSQSGSQIHGQFKDMNKYMTPGGDSGFKEKPAGDFDLI